MKNKQFNKKMTYKELEIIFGIDCGTIRYRLCNSGMSLKEAVETPVNSYIKDLTGKRFYRLTVLHLSESYDKSGRSWICLCDCGTTCKVSQNNLLSGRQKSCGCLNMENKHNRHKDMSGKTVNNVRFIRRAEDEIASNGKHYVRYVCECPNCGNEFVARYLNVKSGNTGGCGCTRHQYTNLNDLTNMDFEFCHVNKLLPRYVNASGGTRTIYECKCCCGKIYSDWAYTILHGRSNCGCKKITSKGEAQIRKWLDSHEISYIPQYWFDDLRGNGNMPYFFDFAVFNKEMFLLCLIEYQGEQHFHEVKRSIPNFGKKQREVSDPAKREYCKNKNIKLYEIAYNEDVNMKLKEIYNLLYHDNTVPSLQETA